MVGGEIPRFNPSLIPTFKDMDVDEPVADDTNLANAVNLSESEDEVEEERIAGDFFTPDTDVVRACLSPGSLTELGIVRIPTLARKGSTSSNFRRISLPSFRRHL